MKHAIRVDITEARLTGLVITFPSDALKLPDVAATIGLLTPDGKQVATFLIQTDHWQQKLKFELPPSILPSLAVLRDEIGRIVTEKCAAQFLGLPERGMEVAVDPPSAV